MAKQKKEKINIVYSTNPDFQFQFDEEPMMITGDEISLKLVFSNLFQNAIKYAGADSEISVRYVKNDNGFMISVSDNGKGIEEKEYKSIFKKFYRVGDENIRETKGTGLGLFLVKQILKSHKADISAEANKPRGTTFNITFKQNVL
jgi:signal transduction histidine kinase